MWTGTSYLSARAARYVAVVLLLATPLLTLWNIAAESIAPQLKVTLGSPLRGVTESRPPANWSLLAFADRKLQDSLTDTVTEALPARPILVRLNNSFRKRLFGIYGAPGVISGDDDELIEIGYLHDYCTRDIDVLRAKAADWIPRLKELQDFYASRGGQLVYITSPTKAAYMPEKFIGRHYACGNDVRHRRDYLPVYREMLKTGGVRVVDAASLTYSLRGEYDIELFPRGGVHWNQLGVAHAADAILEEINRHAGRNIAPRLKWTYEIIDRPTGFDTDLFDVVNVMFARPRFPVPKLTFASEKPCSEWPASRITVTLIGGSFVFDLARTLIEHGCLHALYHYNYLIGTVSGGVGYQRMRDTSTAEELRLLRDSDIVILEENEAAIPGMLHAHRFYDAVLGE